MPGIESFGQLQPQPLNLQPTQQLPFAEPQARTLDIKFNRPLDLQATPQNLSEAIQQSNQLNPVGLAGASVVSKGLALAGVLAENYQSVSDELAGFTPLEENTQLLADSIAAGTALEEPQPIYAPAPFTGGQVAGKDYLVFITAINPAGQLVQLHNSVRKGPISRAIISLGAASYGMRLYAQDSTGQQVTTTLANYFNVSTPPQWAEFTVTPVSGTDTGGNPQGEYLGDTVPARQPNVARQANKAPFKAPLNLPGFTPTVNDLPEPQIDLTSDLTPDELADMLVPRIDPLTGEIDKNKPKVPYWELPEDEWLISPPIVPDLQDPPNDPTKDPVRFPPVIYLDNDGKFTPILDRPIELPDIIYPTKPNDCCSNAGEPCDLTPVIELLTTSVESEVSLTPCGDGDVIELNSSGLGIDGLSQKIDVLAGALIKIWDKVKCPEDNDPPLIPEWWPVRKGANRPQLIVVYGVKENDGTFNRATRYSFSIPWFEGKNRQSLSQLLPKNIKKGRYQATLTLSDNSKIIHFCRNKNESIRVVKEFEKLVIPKYRTGDIKTSDNQGSKRVFKEVTVNPIMAKFYPTGQLDIKPVWVDRFY